MMPAAAASDCANDDGCSLLIRASVDGLSQYFFAERADANQRLTAGRQLASAGFAVIDGLLGAAGALRLRDQALALYRREPRAFSSGAVGGGRDGDGDRYTHSSVRGDKMTLLASEDARIPLLGELLAAMDSLLEDLGRHGGASVAAELRAIDRRSSPSEPHRPT